MKIFPSIALSCAMCFGCAAPHRAAKAIHTHREFSGRSDGMIAEDMWSDTERGGGVFLFTDPNVTAFHVVHTNQATLGGGSVLDMGTGSVTVDPQTSGIISATGTAAGNIIGAALKTAVKP